LASTAGEGLCKVSLTQGDGCFSCNAGRLHDSYEALKDGEMAEAMEDFTGGVVESYNMIKELNFDLFAFLRKSKKLQSLEGCSITYKTQLYPACHHIYVTGKFQRKIAKWFDQGTSLQYYRYQRSM